RVCLYVFSCCYSIIRLVSLSITFVFLLDSFFLFFFNDPATTEIYTLSLHDALPISISERLGPTSIPSSATLWHLAQTRANTAWRSEEHTSELQSPYDLVCRLLLEKKKQKKNRNMRSEET